MRLRQFGRRRGGYADKFIEKSFDSTWGVDGREIAKTEEGRPRDAATGVKT